MKNPFSLFKSGKGLGLPQAAFDEAPRDIAPKKTAEEAPDDGFTEWCRSRVRGGVEKREYNEFFEEYTVYGVDGEGRLTCRRWHRYPEQERNFGMSYSRILSFDDLNQRLLAELDKGDLKLAEYNDCIGKAEKLTGIDVGESASTDFTEGEAAALRDFCDSIDILQNKNYLHGDGVFSCSCESAVGAEALNIRFRKPIKYDSADAEPIGVSKESIAGYDLDNLWIMGVFNRLNIRCASCKVTKMTYDWSAAKETVFLMNIEGFPDIDGTILAAVGMADDFRRFGFYSLSFSGR